MSYSHHIIFLIVLLLLLFLFTTQVLSLQRQPVSMTGLSLIQSHVNVHSVSC